MLCNARGNHLSPATEGMRQALPSLQSWNPLKTCGPKAGNQHLLPTSSTSCPLPGSPIYQGSKRLLEGWGVRSKNTGLKVQPGTLESHLEGDTRVLLPSISYWKKLPSLRPELNVPHSTGMWEVAPVPAKSHRPPARDGWAQAYLRSLLLGLMSGIQQTPHSAGTSCVTLEVLLHFSRPHWSSP